MAESLIEDPSCLSENSLGLSPSPQRRIRHITSIQVRNLTPFPVRDAFALALLQPSAQSQFTSHGHLSDDLDVTVGRKRSRRISSSSVNTMRSKASEDGIKSDELRGGSMGSPESRPRTGSSARVNFASPHLTSQPNGSPNRPPGAGPSIRPSNRPRTTSIVSSVSLLQTQASTSAMPSSTTRSFPAILPDNSQKALEKVINSRLIETFISITAAPSSPGSSQEILPPHSSTAASPSLLKFPSTIASPGTDKLPTEHRKSASLSSSVRKGAATPNQHATVTKTLTRRDSARTAHPAISIPADSVPKPNGRPHVPLQSLPSTSSPSKLQAANGALRPSAHTASIPNYLSSIHRPSTNPFFAIDAQSGSELAGWTDLSGENIHVECWGKVASDYTGNVGSLIGKGKENTPSKNVESKQDWKVLEEWSVNLANLVPLPEHLSSHPLQLPSNTILITLAPHDQVYYLPSKLARSRSPSPSAGYNSDPESSSRKSMISSISRELTDGERSGQFARGARRNGTSTRESRSTPKTAGWQDLLKLATLQTCIADTEESLSEIITSIDATLHGDVVAVLKREASERECLVEEIRSHCDQVKRGSEELRDRIATRKELLRVRRENLSQAQEHLEEDLSRQFEVEAELANERAQLTSLRKGLPPARTTLIATLAAIFPIELLSPPDLLYTILAVPLPIPLSSTDPAPPLSLPDHKEVTEDAVATGLGFAAQVVQLLAAYLSKSLVYPITCVGSRSLIRDGISAMVGPRMFPLFSKGVDTYRFEYGVFLLNKDIEMLMADRDLRALDMRHTLPNLKNLLLTLSDGEGTRLRTPRMVISPTTSVSGLESPRAQSPPLLELTVATSAEPEGPGSSGASTPTATATSDDRKTRSLLGFYPLAGFLRSRYPSVVGRPSVKSVSETHEGPEPAPVPSTGDTPEASSGSGEDDDDRRTIRGAGSESQTEQEVKRIPNGDGIANAGLQGHKEKSPHDADPTDVPVIVSDMG
ncbi:hypothetical protein FIBSPDRAFT_916567 [Athelia psychrophila]|uniref:Autophagy-related protein 14 n=1 Tax=Athelia psychrophila TaxID=1759441 RepID=A0A166V7J6_9AGAM|nr:hypothetical protein FIBSPDRAFT_916567 [Fibularhizoctonia sp. CBS 109695]